MNAFDAARKNGKEAGISSASWMIFFTSQNTSTAKDVTIIPANVLRVTVTVS